MTELAAQQLAHLRDHAMLYSGSGFVDYCAQHGYLELLDWAYANTDKPLSTDSTPCMYAVRGGYLDVLKWLHAHGARCDERLYDFAVQCGNMGAVHWLHALLTGAPVAGT